MTDEDMQLVARAALHGACFIRVTSDGAAGLYWATKQYPKPAKWTIARAAAEYLKYEGLMSERDCTKYLASTYMSQPVDVDLSFLEQLNGEQSNG